MNVGVSWGEAGDGDVDGQEVAVAVGGHVVVPDLGFGGELDCGLALVKLGCGVDACHADDHDLGGDFPIKSRLRRTVCDAAIPRRSSSGQAKLATAQGQK